MWDLTLLVLFLLLRMRPMAPHCNLLFSKRFAIHPKKRSDLGLSFVSKSDLSSLIYSKSLCDLIFFYNPCFVSKNNYPELHKSKKSNKEGITRPHKAVIQLKRERRKMRFNLMVEHSSPPYIPHNTMWNGTQNRSWSMPAKYSNLLTT